MNAILERAKNLKATNEALKVQAEDARFAAYAKMSDQELREFLEKNYPRKFTTPVKVKTNRWTAREAVKMNSPNVDDVVCHPHFFVNNYLMQKIKVKNKVKDKLKK